MSKIIPLILTVILVSSCSFNSPLKFEVTSISNENFDGCISTNCPSIKIQFLKASGNNQKSQKVNRHIEGTLIDLVAAAEDDRSYIAHVSEAVQFFIEDFKKFRQDFGNNYIDYDVDTFMQVSHQSESLVSIELNYYLFTGGAHGFNGTKFLNFNAKTGELLSNETLFKPTDEFIAICENKFRTLYQIPEDRSINATGFWFERDSFYLPDNIGFTETEMILYYNQNDIASYAEGPIVMSIPIEDVVQFLEYY
jgi:hypothetical protein